MNNQLIVEFLKKYLACRESLKWMEGRDLAKTWAECERGDWLLWLAAKAGIDRKRLVMAACACARLALVHVRAGEERPRIAIETAESWCRGEATIEQVREARRNAYAADAVGCGVGGVAAAAAAAASYASYADKITTERKTADIVRSMITVEEIEAAIMVELASVEART